MTRVYKKDPAVTAARKARRLAKWLPIAEAWSSQYRSGVTLKQIGDANGITRERVRQVMTEFLGITAVDGGQCVTALAAAQRRKEKKDARYLKEKGCTFDEYRAVRGKATRAYCSQVRNADRRGIPWEMNFWQWWTIWQQSGRWAERGRGSGYVMCRIGDAGPYSPDNVFIAPGRLNSSEGQSSRKKHDLPIGVREVRGRFVAHACVNGKKRYLGAFGTALEAHVAYLHAITGLDRVAA